MAVTLAPSAPPQTRTEPRAPCRIRRAPALEPPADEDRPADDHPVCAGQLALFTSVHGAAGGGRPPTPARPPGPAQPAAARRPARPGPGGGPSAPTGPPRAPGTDRRAAPAAAPQAALKDPRAALKDPRPAGGAPVPARVAAGRFVSACVEVLNGFRPVTHLRALTSPVEFAAVATQLTRRTARVRMPDRARTGQERVRLRRLQVFDQPTGVAETVAVLRHGDTAWAMALRFERHRDGWLCTLLEVI